MYTKNQELAILKFFNTNQQLLKALYNHLVEKGISVGKEREIYTRTNEVCRYLICNNDNCEFSSGEGLINEGYSYKNPKGYSRFSVWFDRRTIESDGNNQVCIDNNKGEISFEQFYAGSYEKVDIVDFYGLALKHINSIQEEINTFVSHFGLPTIELQAILNFVTPEILHEKLPENPYDMKPRDFGFLTIVATAIKKGDYVILGTTHSNCGNKINKDAEVRYSGSYGEDGYISGLQFGYITSDGTFVLSKVAWRIAQKAGRIDENIQCFTQYSEDFYNACGKEFDIPYARKKIIS